ncbi:hypothetical protein V6B16_03520 [Salinimicrobium catena]|uniref:hypothetical protein n=1 Tax=Salinimicrobium catena TaxID=390640 RepID=UPI002FE4E8FC
MKIAGIILSILVLMLNAVPCCWDSDSKEEPLEEHSGEESCSPFLSCGSCTGFALQEELPGIDLYAQPSVSETIFPETPFQSDFSEAIWQPPRFINELPLF